MKKVIAINICLIAAIFLSAGFMARPASSGRQAELLLSERIDILNSYYSGETNYDDSRASLELIEGGKLLKEDIALMKAFERTDIEQIPSHQVELLSFRTSRYGIIKGKARIYYTLEGIGGRYRQSAKYYFTGEKDDAEVKLTQLKKI